MNDRDVRERIAASAKRTLHQQTMSQTDEAYSNYIQNRYAAPSVAALAAATTDATIMNPGDQRITFEPLDTEEERRKIPRADGYDVAHPGEPRYGPSWKSEEQRRQELLQKNPYYRFLLMMAGYADTNVMKLVSVESMIQRATAADVRKRITDLAQQRSLQNLEGITQALDKAQKEMLELSAGLEEQRYQQNLLAKRQALTRQRDTSITAITSMERLQRKYERLQEIFHDWVVRVFSTTERIQDIGARILARTRQHSTWMESIVPATSKPDQNLLRDFVFGIEFGDATQVALFSLKRLYDEFNKLPSASATGGVSLPPDIRREHGKTLVDALRAYAERSYDNPSRMDMASHVVSLSAMPTFKFNEGIMWALERPARVGKRLIDIERELAQSRMQGSGVRAQVQEEKAELIKEQATLNTGITIDVLTWERIGQVIELLEEHSLKRIETADYLTWLGAFGDVVVPAGLSISLQQKIASLINQQEELGKRNTSMEAEIDRLEERESHYRVLKQRVETLRVDVTLRRAKAEEAERELQDLEVRFYQQTHDYASRPENSGVMDLDPIAIASLDHAHSLATGAMQQASLTLHELMTDEQYWCLFARLAGLCRKLHGMTSGRSFAQMEQVYRCDEAIETLLGQHFSRLGNPWQTSPVPPPIWQVKRDLSAAYGTTASSPVGFNSVGLVNRDGSSAFVVPGRNNLWQ